MLGKIAGSFLGAAAARAEKTVRLRLPTSMCAQAGLAIGLTLALRDSLPDLAPGITAIVLSAVIIFELIGPFGVRWSMIRAGEAQPETEPAGEEIEV